VKPTKNTKRARKSTCKVQSLTSETKSVSSNNLTSSDLELEELEELEELKLTLEEQKKIQEAIRHAQLEFAKIKTSVVKEKRREIETLDSTLKEFIGPFMLIGYDLNNNPIEMVSASSAAEHDALLERLRRVMFKINQNIMNSGGNDPYGFNPN